MSESCDFLVIGAGIAGTSAAFELARLGRVILLEQEDRPGHHTTGRSAALYTENYGNAVIRRLTSASRGFFDAPGEGFGQTPLLTPRGTLFIAREDQRGTLAALLDEIPAGGRPVHLLDAAAARALNPLLRPGYAAAALHEPGAEDIDVHALHSGYLRGLQARGGELRCKAQVGRLTRKGDVWEATTPAGRLEAPVVVNAAGAWADAVAAAARIAPLGLVPKRRTAFIVDAPQGTDTAALPATIDVDERFYFRPDGGRILCSPADETPSSPCDAQAEEIDIAIGAERVEAATTLTIRHIRHRWAGLRSFFADKTPAAGMDPACPGFFWLAGQGGYGIQTAPALACSAAALVETGDLPAELVAAGLTKAMLAPARLR